MVKRKAPALIVASAAILVCGCGGGKNYVNNPRPPQLLIVTAAIAKDRVVVSPANFGAGPVQLTVANETGASQQVTVASDQPGVLNEQTPPINPGDTASLKAVLAQGSYSVRVDGSPIHGARLHVGPQRPSSQNQLLQP